MTRKLKKEIAVPIKVEAIVARINETAGDHCNCIRIRRKVALEMPPIRTMTMRWHASHSPMAIVPLRSETPFSTSIAANSPNAATISSIKVVTATATHGSLWLDAMLKSYAKGDPFKKLNMTL